MSRRQCLELPGHLEKILVFSSSLLPAAVALGQPLEQSLAVSICSSFAHVALGQMQP